MGRKPFVRQKILEAAFDVIARRGYEAVSTRDIADAAGVGPTSMYRHFPSKEDLGRELYATAIPPVVDLLDEELARQADAGAQSFVTALTIALYRCYDERPRALALLVFPPHDFMPDECNSLNPEAIRARLLQAVGDDADLAALVWGAITGALQDRFLSQRSGEMAPSAPLHAQRICQLLGGIES